MDFDEYQTLASKTDQHPKVPGDASDDSRSILIPLLGLAGETGELVSEYKKRLRDGEAYSHFDQRMAEELGDLLWYLANIATKFDLSLSSIARSNLEKTDRRWNSRTTIGLLDDGFPVGQQFPRDFMIDLKLDEIGRAQMFMGTQQLGDPLTDNAYEPDGYRFHDVFHLTYAALLGWSPVIRALMKRKRKSKKKVDEVDDGARARIIEEGIAAMLFGQFEFDNSLGRVQAVRYELLRTIKLVTSHLEVSVRTERDWERAIIRSFEVWNTIENKGGGRLHLNLERRTIDVIDKDA